MNEFRVFISSTFNDFKVERNALQQFVFPMLHKLANTFDIRFYPIDLRWGISDQAAQKHLTIDICQKELKRCQESGTKPCFMFMLGDRYGYCPIPNVIPISVFEKINEHAKTEESTLLHRWYKFDKNIASALNPQGAYCLLPQDKQFQDSKSWHLNVAYPISELISRAIDRNAIKTGKTLKFPFSATHYEIEQGLLERPSAQQECFGVLRTIKNLENISDLIAPNVIPFVDITSDGHLDKIAHERANSLKLCVEEVIPEDSILKIQTTFHNSDIDQKYIGELAQDFDVCMSLLEEASTPSSLCEFVWFKLGRAILQAGEEKQKKTVIELEKEAHARFRKKLNDIFIGRVELLDKFQQIMTSSSGDTIVFVGATGSGKSAIISKCLQSAIDDSKNKAVIIERYIGASTRSFKLIPLLKDICAQIALAYNYKLPPANSFAELKRSLDDCLKLASADRPLLLFIDSLERVDQYFHPQVEWIPPNPPPFVKVVTSVSSDNEACLQAIKNHLNPDSLLMIPNLLDEEKGEQNVSTLFNTLLNRHNRRLQRDQSQIVFNRFKCDRSPLFIHLAVEHVKNWYSFTEVKSTEPETFFPSSSEDLIMDRINRLHSTDGHGPEFTSKTLFFLSLSKNGLSEQELVELLSNNERVMNEFSSQSHHETPTKGIPLVLWARLYNDLQPYLTNRRDESTDLLDFTHPVFRRFADRDPVSALATHTAMSQYFLEIEHPPDPDLRTKQTWNFKYPVSSRTITELPHHCLRMAQFLGIQHCWSAFAQILINCAFFRSAWDSNSNEVRHWWTEIEKNSSIRLLDLLSWTKEPWSPAGIQKLIYLIRDLGYTEAALEMQKNLMKEKYPGSSFQQALEGDYANLLINQGKYSESMEIQQRTADTYKRHNNQLPMAASIQSQGIIKRRQGNPQEACRLFDESDRIAEQFLQSPDEVQLATQTIANNAGNRGNALLDMGRYKEAMEEHSRQESLCESIGDSKGVATAIGNQAGILIGQVDNNLLPLAALNNALDLINRQHELAEQTNDHENIHRALANKAVISMMYGRWKNAIRLFKKDIEICKKCGYLTDLANIYLNAATAYNALGDFRMEQQMLIEHQQLVRRIS